MVKPRGYFCNFNWLLAEKLCRLVGTLLVGVWVARHLGPARFGALSFALAFITFFAWASHLGLNLVLVRELSRTPTEGGLLLGTAFAMKLAGGVAAMAMAYLVARTALGLERTLQALIVTVSAIYLFQALDVVDFHYQAKVRSIPSVMARTAGFVISSMLRIAAILARLPLLAFAAATALDAALAAWLKGRFYRRDGNSISAWHASPAVARRLLAQGWPLMVSSFVVHIQMKIDQVMIERMLGLEAVGVYSVAARLGEAWHFVPITACAVFLPYFVQLRERDQRQYQQRLVQLLSVMFWAGIAVGVLATAAGRPVMGWLFGPAFVGAHPPLAIMVWAGVFVAQRCACGVWQVCEGLQLYPQYVQALAVLTNVGLNLCLIPPLGINGAAVSTLATYLLAAWGFGLLFPRARPITLMALRATSPGPVVRLIRERFL